MEFGKVKEKGKKNEIFALLYNGNIAAGFIKDATVNHIKRLKGMRLLCWVHTKQESWTMQRGEIREAGTQTIICSDRDCS